MLLSNYNGYYLGDPRFDRLFFELNRQKAVVFIHPATPPGIEKSHFEFPESMIDVWFDTTRTAFSLILNGVAKKYPDVRFILAHAGGTVPYTAARLYIIFSAFESVSGARSTIAKAAGLISSVVPKLNEAMPENFALYLKVKENMSEGPDFYLKKFHYDTALSVSPHAFSSLQTLVDTSKIVFGTDYIFAPETVLPLTIKAIREYAGFNAKDIVVIGKENAMNLFQA